jgi:hypothetical protein
VTTFVKKARNRGVEKWLRSIAVVDVLPLFEFKFGFITD